LLNRQKTINGQVQELIYWADDILSTESWFDKKEVKLSREFLNKDDKEINVAIRRAILTGRPLGSEGFIKRLERILRQDLFPKKGGRPKKKE